MAFCRGVDWVAVLEDIMGAEHLEFAVAERPSLMVGVIGNVTAEIDGFVAPRGQLPRARFSSTCRILRMTTARPIS